MLVYVYACVSVYFFCVWKFYSVIVTCCLPARPFGPARLKLGCRASTEAVAVLPLGHGHAQRPLRPPPCCGWCMFCFCGLFLCWCACRWCKCVVLRDLRTMGNVSPQSWFANGQVQRRVTAYQMTVYVVSHDSVDHSKNQSRKNAENWTSTSEKLAGCYQGKNLRKCLTVFSDEELTV